MKVKVILKENIKGVGKKEQEIRKRIEAETQKIKFQIYNINNNSFIYSLCKHYI